MELPSPPHVLTDEGYEYRAVISLNNTGVSLLKGGSFRLALETFKDSILLLKRLYCPNYQLQLADSSAPTIQCMLDAAGTRLATTFIPTPGPSQSPRTASVRPLSYDRTGFNGLHISLDQLNTSNFCFPVWMECFESIDSSIGDDESSCESPEEDFQSALIFYNFALAQVCLAKEERMKSLLPPFPSPMMEHIQLLHQGASEVFHVVYEVLYDSLHSSTCSPWMEENLLVLACLSLAQSRALKQDNGNLFEAQVEAARFSSAFEAWQRLRLFMGPLICDTPIDYGDGTDQEQPPSFTPYTEGERPRQLRIGRSARAA
jgi:hypothetical protein